MMENLFDNLLVIGILATLAAIIYCRVTQKTLGDVIRELKDAFSSRAEEVVEPVY